MPPTDPAALLRELCRLPAETEWVEFKRNNAAPDEIGEYVSALANSAALHARPRGYLVWGVADGTHEIVGTTFRPRGQKVGNQDLEPWLHHLLSPRIDFAIHELNVGAANVVIFEVQAASSSPVRFKDHDYIRVGSHKHKLKDYPEKERALWATLSATAFETGVAANGLDADEVLDRLDFSAYFRLAKRPLPDAKSGILARLTEESLVVRESDGRYAITNLGAILFARDLDRFGRLGRKACRVIKYVGDSRTRTEREWEEPAARVGYAAGFETIVSYVNSQLPESEHIGPAFRRRVRVYPEIAVRELVANMLIHQDFDVRGAGPMVEIFASRVEFTNPGEPLVDTDRFIDATPKSRNEGLARMMRRLALCEERGTGIDKAVEAIELFQLPPPEFRRSPGATQVFLFAPKTFAEMDAAQRIRACYQHSVLRWLIGSPMTNATLRKRLGIADANYSSASRVIRDTIAAGLIVPLDPAANRKHLKYVPVRE